MLSLCAQQRVPRVNWTKTARFLAVLGMSVPFSPFAPSRLRAFAPLRENLPLYVRSVTRRKASA